MYALLHHWNSESGLSLLSVCILKPLRADKEDEPRPCTVYLRPTWDPEA